MHFEILIEKREDFFFFSQKNNVEHIHLIPRAGDMTISTADVYNADVYDVNNRWKESENAVVSVKYSTVLSRKRTNFAQATTQI